MEHKRSKVENKNIVVSLLFIIAIGVVIYSFLGDNKLFGGSSVNGNGEVGSGNVIVTDSKDIDVVNSQEVIDDKVENNNENIENVESDKTDKEVVAEKKQEQRYFIEGDFLADGVVSDGEKVAMASNTKYLQELVDNAKEGQIIKLPAGIFYFSSGGENIRGVENYVIKLNHNVNIVGSGIEEGKSGEYTILKPYADKGTIKYGLDMFYWNELSDSYGKNPQYLENISFSDFIIDGEDVRGNTYNTSGKGFMINLCRDCHWDNMIIRNTDGTGFGMDNVIDGSITNSVAVNCGKNATTSDGGASGFGIGTGYSNEESMYIENCRSIGNTKFGFFFEHQNRFNTKYYKATKSNGFVVVNSYASGNLYNFGGERANDVVYINCESNKDTVNTDGTKIGYTELDVYFSDQSRRVSVINLSTNNSFSDVTNKSAYYYDAVNWALRNGYTYGVSGNKFGIGKSATRAEAVVMLWRMAGMPGDVLRDSELSSSSKKVTNIKTGFTDVSSDVWYVSAIKWAVDNKITNGTSSTAFSPNDVITRAQFVTMLWRYAGSPKVVDENIFSDVSVNDYYYDAVRWAYSKGIVKGTSIDKFSPLDNCTREQVVTFLYRYQNVKGNNYSIRYLLMGGNVNNNQKTYLSSSNQFTLYNPSKSGYTFVGWVGSNGNIPSKKVTISKKDVGNKTFVAVFKKNS